MSDLHKKIAKRFLKTAGEVRFIKDKSGDGNEWAFADSGASKREITPQFAFNPKHMKPLAQVLRATTAALGHTMSAYSTFAKVKSAKVSPDGSLGGKGYVMKISNMRRQYMNAVEALSALSDTIYDELHAPHWAAISRQEDPEDRAEIQDIIQDAEEIRQDPEAWAEDEEEEIGEEKPANVKTASANNPDYVRSELSKLNRDELQAYYRILVMRQMPRTILVGDPRNIALHKGIVEELLGKKASTAETPVRHLARRFAFLRGENNG